MKGWVAALRLIGLGWYIVVSIGLGLAGGLWLDDRLHLSPLFTLLGLLLGLGIAFVGVFRLVAMVFGNRENGR